MDSKLDISETVTDNIERRGRAAVERAREEIMKSSCMSGAVSEAMKHFATVTLGGGLPVFPSLISISRELVDGRIDDMDEIGAALTLVAGTADIHDDIIDRSAVKYSKETVFGKFGAEIALLAGDALMLQGTTLLHRQCAHLPRVKCEAVFSRVLDAMFEICEAEAKESLMMGKKDVKAQEVLEIIQMKATVPDLHCSIGGILGGGSEEIVAALGQFGRVFGVASIVRDEFLDLFDYQEFQNRIRNEYLPLPVLEALTDPSVKEQMMPLIEGGHPSELDIEAMCSLILSVDGVKQIRKRVFEMVSEELKVMPFNKNSLLSKEATLLLRATIEEI